MVLNLPGVLTCQTGMSGGQLSPCYISEGNTKVRATTVTFQVPSGYKMEAWFEVNGKPWWAQTESGRG